MMSIGDVGRMLGIDRWRLAYLLERGKLPAPSVEVPGRRLFSDEDVRKIREAIARDPKLCTLRSNCKEAAHD